MVSYHYLPWALTSSSKEIGSGREDGRMCFNLGAAALDRDIHKITGLEDTIYVHGHHLLVTVWRALDLP